MTAGTSSPLTDGASAVLLTSEDYARANGLPILARIKAVAISGCKPETMGLGPIASSKKALERAGIAADQLDVVELNEAFASQSLACIRDLGLDIAKINLDGGAIAIGHPLGATGARIVGKAAALLKREGGKYARSPPSASAAGRASPPCWRRRNERRHQKVCVIGAGTMGAGIAAQVANAACPCCCSTSCATRRTAMRSPPGRWRRC